VIAFNDEIAVGVRNRLTHRGDGRIITFEQANDRSPRD
jgi:hypothetical protein